MCWAVYRFHFQFLVFLGSYVKLLDVFYAAKQAETVSYAVVFNVFLNQLAYSQHESCASSVGILFTFEP